MKELLIATKNPGKFREILEVLGGGDGGAGDGAAGGALCGGAGAFKFVFLGDLEVSDEDFVEDGDTFEENAFKKASYYSEKLGMMALGEDSGIFVDAFPGELGVTTRRWGAGEHASDDEWMDYFMRRMEGVPERERGARFVCGACIYGEGVEEYFRGETVGVITKDLECDVIPGIPLGSCFKPEGSEKVFSALSVEEKNRLSHRGKAMHEIKKFLEEFSG